MSRIALPVAALVACYALFFGYIAFTYDALPPTVASHFDLHGNPNGWMPRDASVGITIAVVIIIPALVIGTMAGAGHIPISFINLPHRDYWLAPERRQSALTVLLRYSIWFAALNVLFMTGLHWLTVEANLHSHGHLNVTLFAIQFAFYLLGTVAWVARLLRHFSRLP